MRPGQSCVTNQRRRESFTQPLGGFRVLKDRFEVDMAMYVGPDQIVPLSSVLGTVVGLALMFWGRLATAFRKMTDRFSSKDTEKP
jgi:hypothetical protein